MRYELEIANADSVGKYIYDTTNNVLYDSFGNPFTGNVSGLPASLHIRITLGLGCNYHCSYCSQTSIKCNDVSDKVNYDKFVTQLKSYVDAHFPDIENVDFSLWGGEPLLYFNHMKELLPRLRAVFGSSVRMSFSSNGELLTEEIVEWVKDYNVALSLSYDGGGQIARSKHDVFAKTSKQLVLVKELIKSGALVIFSPVFHKLNPSVVSYIQFMQELLQTDNFVLGECSPIRVYDEYSLQWQMSEEQLRTWAEELITIQHTAYARYTPQSFISRMLKMLRHTGATELPSHCDTHKQTNYLCVDLNGGVWFCHNCIGTLSNEHGESLVRGNIYKGDCRILTLPSHNNKLHSTCKNCLFRWECVGGCPLLSDKYAHVNCKISQYSSYVVFHMLMSLFTDGYIIGIRPHTV